MGAPDAGAWVGGVDVASPDRLRVLLAPIDEGLGDPVVAVSTFVQGYAVRVAGTAVTRWLRDGRAPSPAAEHTTVRIDHGLTTDVAWTSSVEDVSSVDALADALFARHLDPLVAACVGVRDVSPALLWGNVAAAIAAPLGDAHDALPPVEQGPWRERSGALLDAFPHELGRLGAFWLTPGPSSRWCWERRSCCLWYRIDPDGRGCDACSLLPAADRRARLARSV